MQKLEKIKEYVAMALILAAIWGLMWVYLAITPGYY